MTMKGITWSMHSFLRRSLIPLIRSPFTADYNVKYKSVSVDAKPSAFLESESAQCGKNAADRTDESTTHRDEIPYRGSQRGHFVQKQPVLRNQFLQDVTLQSYLKRIMPQNVYSSIEPDLKQFGHQVAADIYDWHLQCERDQPQLQHFDAWGNRVDRIITSSAWKKMHDISAQEGLIAIPYERQFAEHSRLYQISKLYLFAPSSAMYCCPLAMTDAAARTLQVSEEKSYLTNAYKRLTSRDPSAFWTSGQWMTENRGGSDVANGTETLAVPQANGSYKLYGYKWFSSATDSDMTLTLARIVDDHGQTKQGTKGISMFYMETRNKDGSLNNIEIQKLKDKLGTRALPTAELLLCGSSAHLVGEEGRGIPAISTMLTLSRMHNIIFSVGYMRRIVNLARDYSTRREAFGKIITDFPLHMKTLANLEIEVRAGFLMMMELGRIIGLTECGIYTEQDKLLLRLLTPVTKLVTAKQAVAVSSEGLECFGGQGYIEDTGLPSILRDSQVFPIWEGTTNILSLDVLRSIHKSQGDVLKAFHTSIYKKMTSVTNSELSESAERVLKSATYIVQFATEYTTSLEVAAREFAFSIGYTYMGSLLIEHSDSPDATTQDVFAAKRWCERDLIPMMTQQLCGNYSKTNTDLEYELVMDEYSGSLI